MDQISVFQRYYILYSKINIIVQVWAGTLMFDISTCEIGNLKQTLWYLLHLHVFGDRCYSKYLILQVCI